MAAGLGTRLQPFTVQTPKALIPVMGVPSAQFSLDLLRGTDIRTLVANVHHLSERAERGLHGLALPDPSATLTISDETPLLLGSGGGIRAALSHLGAAPFLVLNADVLCEVDIRGLIAFHHRMSHLYGAKITLAVHPCSSTGEAYREILFDPRSGLMTGLGEKSLYAPFFTGFSIMDPSALEGLEVGKPRDFVRDVLLPAQQRGQVAVFADRGHFFDVGTPRLWWQTHLRLLDMLEMGHIPPPWRERIERNCVRVAPRVWRSKRTSGWIHRSEWHSPTFVDAPALRGGSVFGPGAVIYSPEGRYARELVGPGICLGPDAVFGQEFE